MRRSAPTTTIHRPQAVLRPIWRGDGEENLMRDAAMDSDTDGDGAVDSFGTRDDTGVATFSFDTGTSPNSQKVSISTTGAESSKFAGVRQFVLRVFPGDEILMSVEAKAANLSDAKGFLLADWKDPSGGGIGGNLQLSFTNTSFQRMEISGTAPDGVGLVIVTLSLFTTAADGQGDVWFRNARLLRASSDPATWANPHVSGGSQTGSSLDTAGWPASTSIIKEGDVFLIGGSGATQPSADPFTQLYRATSDVSSDSNGDATIPVDPEVTSPPDGAALRFHHGKPGVVT